jgi:hypothetical protein
LNVAIPIALRELGLKAGFTALEARLKRCARNDMRQSTLGQAGTGC